VVNRRSVRLVVVLVVALLALAVSGLVALPTIARRVIVWQLGSQTGRSVSLDAVEIRLAPGRIALRNLRVMDRDGGPLASVERLELRFRSRDLLRFRLRIIDGVLHAPALRVVRTGAGTFNVSDLIKPGGGGGRFTVTIDRFVVRAGAVTVEDAAATPRRAWRVDGVTVDVRDVSMIATHPPGTVTVGARVASAPVTLALRDVRLAPLHFRGALTARDVDVALAALALPPQGPFDAPRGTVSVSATIDHDGVAGSRVGLDVGFAGVEVRRAGQDRALVTAPAIRLTVDDLRARSGVVTLKRVAVDGGNVTLEDARLGGVKRWTIDGIAFEARDLSSARDAAPGIATARAGLAGAQVSMFAGNVRLAPVELQATVIVRNVDLALMRIYLPPDLPVQPERGVLNATFRVEHHGFDGASPSGVTGPGGTRIALDASVTGMELRRPAHFVTAPAVRVTAEDITYGNGAVTIGRVGVTGERLALEERTAKPPRTWDVRDLAFDAKDLSSRRDVVQGVASVRATVAGASVSAWVTKARLDPLELHATTILRNVDLGLARLYLPPEVPVESARGTVNASVQIDHTGAEGTRVHGDATVVGLAARGRGPAATLALTAPSVRVTVTEARRRGAAVSVGRVDVVGHGVLTDSRTASSRVDVAQLRFTTEDLTWPVRGPARVEVSARFGDRGELDATGTARLTAPPPTIAWQADLALKFRRVDLTPVGVYLPAARGLGGRVRADITAAVAYAGALTARVQGNVGGGRFILADGDRQLLGLRRIDITGLDAQWPERVSIQKLHLREPFALVERDRQGALPLLARFARAPGASTPATAAAPQVRVPTVAIAEVVFENGRATVVDDRPDRRVRIEMPRVDFTAHDVTWPASRPAKILLDAALPGGGNVRLDGAVSAEPSVDLTLRLKDADISPLQPYFGFRADMRARVDASLTVAGPLARPAVRGDVGFRGIAIADGPRPLVTVEQLRVTGIDVAWPARVTIDRVSARRSWALLARDRQGRFELQKLLVRKEPEPGTTTPVATPVPTIAIREVVFDQQAVTIVDGITTPPARFEVAGARFLLRDFAWPARGPVAIEVATPTPIAGRLGVTGTVNLDPVRLDVRAALDGVAIEPAQPYLPIEGRVAGRITGDLKVTLALEPLAVQVTGDARLQRFRLSDGDRALVAVGRLEAAGVDVDWPRRLAVRNVLLRRPRLLVERDANRDIILLRVATPRWERAPTTAVARDGAPAAPRVATAPPVLEVGTFTLEKADGRFVDRTTSPAYVEELSDVKLVVNSFTTAPGVRTRFTGSGELGGGSFRLAGESTQGDREAIDLKLDLRDVVVARANPYLAHYTSWTATRGSLNATAVYTLTGTRLEARHDIVVRDLAVEPIAERDQVEERVGLPFGFLVSLLKDARGEIKVSLPVSGDVATRAFDFHEAVWAATRNLSLRLLAAPFARVGSLFVSEDSKVKAVSITPVAFEPGTARLGAGMDAHLDQVAGFLRGAPAVNLGLEPIFTQADVDALKREHEGKALPPDALRTLGTNRLDVVRQAVARGGVVDMTRLDGRASRTPFIEAAGNGRVELDVKPERPTP